MLGRTFCPLRSISSRVLGDRRAPGGGVATPGPKQGGVHLASRCPPLPGSLVALKPRIQDPPSPWASAPGPQELQNAAGPRREGRRPRPPLAPTPCCARSTSPMLPCTYAHLMLSAIPLTLAPWDPNGFPCGPTPTGVGGGAGRDLATPMLPWLRSHHVSSVPVCVPRLLSACPLGGLAPPCPLVHPAASSLASD